jgi:hypothetical protein
VALEQLGTIFVYTLPLRLSNPKTMVLPLAPGPLLRFTRRAPKKLSSTSISPEIGDSISHSSSNEKDFNISRDFFVEIWARFKQCNSLS